MEKKLDILNNDVRAFLSLVLNDVLVREEILEQAGYEHYYKDGMKWDDLSANVKNEYNKKLLADALKWHFSKMIDNIDTDALCIVKHRDQYSYIQTDFILMTTIRYNRLKSDISELKSQIEDLQDHISDLSNRY